MEAELITLDTTCTEAEWIKSLLLDIPLSNKPIPAISLHCDNKAVIKLVKQTRTNNKKMNKHMQVRYKSVKKMLSSNIISLDFVNSESNISDQLTKGLSRKVILELSRGMGLNPQGSHLGR